MIESALVTGANSGIGFETCKALAVAGARQVFVACRDSETAELAKRALERASHREVFHPVVIDLAKLSSVRKAADALVAQGARLDLVVLNAGVLPGKRLVLTEDRFEVAAAVSLIGHHVLTMRLFRGAALAPRARIIISGSEGARGDAPGLKPLDLRAIASSAFGGDLSATITATLHMTPPLRHHWSTTYCTAKVLVALWARGLARELPSTVAVIAVSPGNVPGTNASRHQPWFFRALMRVVAWLGPSLGLAIHAQQAAQRYLSAAAMNGDVSGAFFASPPKRLVGPLERQRVPHLVDEEAAQITLQTLERLTGESL